MSQKLVLGNKELSFIGLMSLLRAVTAVTELEHYNVIFCEYNSKWNMPGIIHLYLSNFHPLFLSYFLLSLYLINSHS